MGKHERALPARVEERCEDVGLQLRPEDGQQRRRRASHNSKITTTYANCHVGADWGWSGVACRTGLGGTGKNWEGPSAWTRGGRRWDGVTCRAGEDRTKQGRHGPSAGAGLARGRDELSVRDGK